MTEIILILFLLCLIIQVLFHFLVFRGLYVSKEKTTHSEEIPSVSVIIAARNESKNLPQLIKSLATQEHPQMEVIIINDRSTDESDKVIKKAIEGQKHFQQININSLPDGWTGKKYALLKGIQDAKNEILLFTDADCIPKSSQWATLVAATFDTRIDIVLGFSPYENRATWLNQFIQFETLLTGLQYLGLANLGRPYMGVGRNWAIRKHAYDLEYLKSISDIIGGDDDLMINHLATRTNTSIITAPSSQTISKPTESWNDFFKQKIRHLSVGSHYHQKDKTVLGLFTLAFLFGWIFFFFLLVSTINPYLILATFGLRSLSFYSIFARVGQKFDAPVRFWALLLLDLSYSIYYPVMGLRALSAKNIKWK